jgi:hypothetical protein
MSNRYIYTPEMPTVGTKSVPVCMLWLIVHHRLMTCFEDLIIQPQAQGMHSAVSEVDMIVTPRASCWTRSALM